MFAKLVPYVVTIIGVVSVAILPPSCKYPPATDEVNLTDVIETCNQSFIIPLESFLQFNKTGTFPDDSDRTEICYVRCYFEKSGIITDEGKVDPIKTRKYIWPATGNSIEECEKEGLNEKMPCSIVFSIGKCLISRALVDARSTQIT